MLWFFLKWLVTHQLELEKNKKYSQFLIFSMLLHCWYNKKLQSKHYKKWLIITKEETITQVLVMVLKRLKRFFNDIVPSLPLLAMGSVYVGHGSMIEFVGSWIWSMDSLLFSNELFGHMESINVAGVLQEAEDASVSWIYHHSLHFHIYQIASFVPWTLCPLYCYYKWLGDRLGGAWGVVGLIYNRVWEGDRGWVLSCSFWFWFFFPLVLLSFVLSCPLSLF